ncbi:MAG: PilN domain-containing protein [Candidatus Omnitrophica bacterium]|nr:PilN domain-containing protein [Candidatus Omnitrophota bacterium]
MNVKVKELFKRLRNFRKRSGSAQRPPRVRGGGPRLVLTWNDGQVKGILFDTAQEQWSVRQMKVAPMPADAPSLPSEWIGSFAPAVGPLESWMVLPRQLVSAQVIQLPSTQPAEISEMLRLQLRKLTPYAPHEVMTAHIVLETTPEGYALVLLLAVRWEALSQMVGVVAGSGVELTHVITSTEAISRWIALQTPDFFQEHERVAVLDMDASLSEFVVLSRHGCDFTRAIPIGWNRITEEAERWGEKLIHEIRISLDLYRHSEVAQDRNPEQLLLLGSSPLTAPLGARLSILDMEVRIIDPIAGLPAEAGRPEVGNSSWTTLLGAGLSREAPKADFTPPELLLRQSIRERGREIAQLGVLVISIMSVVSCLFIEKIIVGTRQMNRLNQAIAVLSPDAVELEKALMRIRLAQQRSNPEGSVLRILDRVYRAVPGDVTLTAIRFESAKEVEVKGYSGNTSRIFEFVAALEKIQFFPAVKTKSVAKRRFGKQELTDFEVLCQLSAQVSSSAPKTAEEKPKSWMAGKPAGSP